MIKDNEAVYDEKIHPLMAQILAVCKEHQIPMVATFVYAPEQFCTSLLEVGHLYPDDVGSPEAKTISAVYGRIRNGEPGRFAAFTITTQPASPVAGEGSK